MCGIAGIYNYRSPSAPVDRAELIAIRDAMAVRGPDGFGEWFSPDGGVGLGHRRLSLVDLSDAGAQPMCTADGQFIIVFNGEIYNFRELRGWLEERGHRFYSHTDTEVLLHLYREVGERMVDRLRGMYAFAIWDNVARELFLARDPFGIKPLYYADGGHGFRFASQVKALLAGVRINTSSDAAGQVGFFLWGSVPEPHTLYRGIRALPAGCIMRVNAGGATAPRVFCDVPAILAEGAEQGSALRVDPSERLLNVRGAVEDSVRHHLIADVPVGVFLSSGIDSCTLTGVAAQMGSELRTVTLGFDEYRGTPADETPLSNVVAQHYRTSHETRWVAKAEFHADFERLLHAMDQPSIDGANTYFVSKVAAAQGLKAALSGLGGDELFGGYPSFRQLPRLVDRVSPFRALTVGKAFRVVCGPVLKRLTSPKYAGLLEYGGTYGGAYLLRRGLFMPWELPEVLDPEVVREGWRELQPVIALDQSVAAIGNPRLRVCALETTCYMRNQLLRDADWAGMAHSLEIRVPLVDLELVRQLGPLLGSAYPPDKKTLAAAPVQPLPDAVVHRTKTGFSVPVRQWLGGSAAGRGLRGWSQLLAHRFRMEGLTSAHAHAAVSV